MAPVTKIKTYHFLPHKYGLEMKNVQTTGSIKIEMDQSKRNYLQLVEGSFGSNLQAGLFKKNQ